MPTSVTMPALGESVTEGTVTRWLKQEGEQVEADEPLLEVSTDKVDTEIPSPVAGTLTKILVAEDETVEVGAQLAFIGGGGGGAASAPAPEKQPQEQPAASQQESPKPAPAPAQAASQQPGGDYGAGGTMPTKSPTSAPAPAAAPAPQQPSQGGGDGAGAYVTPLVRRLAAERGVELSSVSGTGVGGRIRKQDVIAAAEQSATPAAVASGGAAAKPAAPAPDTSVRGRTEKISRLRSVIARRMVESLQVSAQLTTVVEAD